MTFRQPLAAGAFCVLLTVFLAACDPTGSDGLTGPLQDDVTGLEQLAPEAPVPAAIELELMPTIMSRSVIMKDLDAHVAKKVAKRLRKLNKEKKRALNRAHVRARRVFSETPEPDADTVAELQAQLDDALATVFDPEDMERIQAAALRLSELPMPPNETSSLSLGKVDPCTDRCTENFTVEVVAAEVMYLSALVGCAYTGPIAPACWGVATVARAAEFITTAVTYSNCLEACREAMNT